MITHGLCWMLIEQGSLNTTNIQKLFKYLLNCQKKQKYLILEK